MEMWFGDCGHRCHTPHTVLVLPLHRPHVLHQCSWNITPTIHHLANVVVCFRPSVGVWPCVAQISSFRGNSSNITLCTLDHDDSTHVHCKHLSQIYYWNSKTRETSWQLPGESARRPWIVDTTTVSPQNQEANNHTQEWKHAKTQKCYRS